MRYLIAILISVLVISCSGVKDAARSVDDPSCPSVVEGTFETPLLFRARGNAMVLSHGRDEMRIRHGKVLSMDSTGVLFDEDREFSWSNPEPKRYALDEIACLVDSASRVTYGTPPTALRAVWDVDLTIRLVDDTLATPLRFEFELGKPFSFCVPPGRYAMTAFHMRRYDQEAWGEFIPMLSFTVERGVVNYLGEIRVDADTLGAPGSFLFPFRVKMNDAGWSTSFGLTGALLDALTTNYGIKDSHLLRIVQDPSYRSALTLPVRRIDVAMRANALLPPSGGGTGPRQ